MNEEDIDRIIHQHETKINKLMCEAATIQRQLDKVIKILEKLVTAEKARNVDNE